MRGDTVSELKALLDRREQVPVEIDGDYVHAAVMMILKYAGEGFSMLFIKRPDNDGDPFSGHMAFPGGKMTEGDDTKLDAAIRETVEEVGIDVRSSGRVLGALDDVNPNNPRASRYAVTPYIAILDEEVEMELCPDEVEAAVWIPVSHLLDDKNFTVRIRERAGREVEDYVYSYGKYIIWGMTGRILRQFFIFSSELF